MYRKGIVVPLLALICLIIILAGYLYIKNQFVTVRLEKEKELQSIAELKINQISEWYSDELHDAKVISQNIFLIERIEMWLNSPRLAEEKSLHSFISSLTQEHGYSNIILTSPEGEILMNSVGLPIPCEPSIVTIIQEVKSTRQVKVSDLYRSSTSNQIVLDFIAPIIGKDNKLLAAIVFRIDPNEFLYTLIETWPYQSKTSESLFIKPVNDSVLFLNKLRHNPSEALTFKLPLSLSHLPAARAISGQKGIYHGIDYRGKKVMSYLGPIPGTPWYMAVKVDRSEMFEGLVKFIFLAVIMFLLAIFLLASLFALFASTRQRNIYKALLQTQEEYRTTLYSIGDGVITTNERGQLLHLNPVAEQLTGWKEKESKGKPSDKILTLVNETTREKVEDPVKQILKESKLEGITNNLLLVAKNGKEIPVSLSGALIKDKNAGLKGVVLVIRNQVAERQKQHLIEESEKRFAAFMQYVPAMVIVKDQELRPVYVNEKFRDVFPADDWLGKKPEETFPPEIAGPMIKNDQEAIEKGYVNYEEVWIDRKGEKHILETHKFRIDRGDLQPMVGAIILDITLRKKYETDLTRERKLLESLITTIPDNIYFKDLNSRFLSINNSMAEIFGLKDPSEAVGKTDFDFFSREHAELAFQDEQKIISTGIPIIAKQEKQTWPDGHCDWVSSTKVPMRDESGKIIGIMGISRDITKNKIAEEALRISEERYKLVSELTSDYIYKIDISESGKLKITFLSESFTSITGRNITQIDTMESWGNIFYPEDIGKMQNFLAQLIEEKKGGEFECRTYIKNKQLRWVNILAEPILSEGRVTSIIGSVKDITERKLAETALKESEDIFKSFMEHSPVYVFFKDENIRVLRVSKNFENMVHLPIDQIMGKSMDDLFPSELAKSMVEDDKKILREGKVVVVDEELEGRFYTTIKYPIYIDENKRYLAGFTIDITEKKRAEEALLKQNEAIEKQNEEYAALNKIYQIVNDELRKSNEDLITARNKAEESDRLKSAFLANMSHEIRTPMNAIIGFSDLIIEPELPHEKLNQYTRTIKQRSYDLLSLINDILDISKIEAAQMVILEEGGNLEDMITDLYNTFKMLWCDSGKSKVNFTSHYHISPNESWIITDFGRLKQILSNLIGNAFKFTREGSITLTCERKDDFLLFSVSDTGIGINHEKQSIIFDRFRQAEEAHSQLFGGAGLGLSISRGLTELLGGKIWVESEPSRGSVFSFTIPYKSHRQNDDFNLELKNGVKNWEGYKILLVEDDQYNSEYLTEALRETGVEIIPAKTGKEALDNIHAIDDFNLVLLDIRLPDIEGFEVARQIKIIRPLLPIIAQTAYASDHHKNLCLQAGCVDYLPKPIQKEELIKSISHWLKKRK